MVLSGARETLAFIDRVVGGIAYYKMLCAGRGWFGCSIVNILTWKKLVKVEKHLKKNSEPGEMKNIEIFENEAHIELLIPPVEPIIGEEDDLLYSAEVALLSRNMRIAGLDDEEYKGAYL